MRSGLSTQPRRGIPQPFFHFGSCLHAEPSALAQNKLRVSRVKGIYARFGCSFGLHSGIVPKENTMQENIRKCGRKSVRTLTATESARHGIFLAAGFRSRSWR